MTSHTDVGQAVWAPVKKLERCEFSTLLENFYTGVKRKYGTPVFAGVELDLFRMFHAVMERGGSSKVEANKQWKVCPCIRWVHVKLMEFLTSFNLHVLFPWCNCCVTTMHACMRTRGNDR